ncbi:MAG: septum formation initiator family protein [Hyphomicrobiaceae bacterium]|nr:septum formation initiator family protein [Hyphomicrobiaceae bacterium]
MSTRLRRPSIIRQLSITVLLIAFQAYLGYSLLHGQYGLKGQEQLRQDIVELEAERALLNTQVDDLRHHLSLLDPARLDPDLITELARSQLSMAHENEILVSVAQN